jgi:hypothetical protein
MIGELVIRFLVGGIVVSLFAAAGELFEPKTFAGLFGAAPSVALGTLALAFLGQGRAYAAIEARSMLVASAALLAYCVTCIVLVRREHVPVWLGAGLSWASWLVVALGSWQLVARLVG